MFPDGPMIVFVIYHKDKHYPNAILRKKIRMSGFGFGYEKLLHAKLKEYGIRKYQN
jgi:hypothetical protein